MSAVLALTGLAFAAGGEDQPSGWAAPGVERAIALGFVPARLQSDYTRPVTRAEFCAIAVAVYENELEEQILERRKFIDTNEVSVQKMGGLGVVAGVGSDKFLPDEPITREQAAVILTRLARAMNVSLQSSSSADAPAFSDGGEIAVWAREAVARGRAAGIMDGTGDNLFSPRGPYTREQSVVTLLKVYDLARISVWQETSALNESASRVLELVNAERAKEGIAPLVTSDLLHAAALVRAVELEERFSHTRPDDRPWHTVFAEVGVGERGRGENLGKGYKTAEGAVAGWMDSPDHKANILNPAFAKLGVGVHEDGAGTLYWAQLFAD